MERAGNRQPWRFAKVQVETAVAGRDSTAALDRAEANLARRRCRPLWRVARAFAGGDRRRLIRHHGRGGNPGATLLSMKRSR